MTEPEPEQCGAREHMAARPKATTGDIGQHVRRVIGVLVTSGRGSPGIRLVAEAVGTSVRTLQRRLHERGLTYGDVVQHARLAAARRMLQQPGRRIGEIAQTLGYSDHAHFTRAFQRWTGLTPKRFRCRKR